MSKRINFVKAVVIVLLVCCTSVSPAPQPAASSDVEPVDLEATVAEKDVESDLEGSSSYGYGYYSSPYLGGHYGGFGGYYPYYGGGYGLGGYYGLGEINIFEDCC